MKDTVQQLRRRSKELLQEGEVDRVLGWRAGRLAWQSAPAVAESPEEVDRLQVGPFSASNLTKYLIDIVRPEHPAPDEQPPGRTAVWARGCDARAINRLITDGVLDPAQVLVLGFSCPGFADRGRVADSVDLKSADSCQWTADEGADFVVRTADGDVQLSMGDVLADRCASCTHPEPVRCDEEFTGATSAGAGDRFAALAEFEEMDQQERYEYWRRQFDRCIRCYACRNVCPACNCVECVFDGDLPDRPDWLGKATDLSDKQMYHITRAFHVAGRCIECGECERICPVNIPLRAIMQRTAADIEELFSEHQAGLSPEETPPLQSYRLDDPEVKEEGST